jgi:hypothetical protein
MFRYSWILLTLISCEKAVILQDNPFDNKDSIDIQKDTNQYDPASILSIHRDIFKPTCANSGCHDGNFEPDFRTVESSYYGLINRSVIKRDLNNRFEFRVFPGNSDASMLIHRMIEDLNGNSGIMPLSLESNSNYPNKKTEYIDRIKLWINNGAQDIYGNKPIEEDCPPIVEGVLVKQFGINLNRVGIYEPVVAKAGSNLEMFFSIWDKETPVGELKDLTFNFSTHPDSFDISNERSLVKINSFADKGLFNKSIDYQWRADIDFNSIPQDVIWVRISVRDSQKLNQIPNQWSMFPLKKYFAVKFQ